MPDIQKSLFKIIPQDFDIFGGIDVDKTKMVVTFTDHQQNLKTIQMPAKPENLMNYIRNHFPQKRVLLAYEAGPTGYHLYDQLTVHQYPCLVLAPSKIPQIPGAQVKTNRLDSQRIAEALRGGQLKSIHVPSPSYRHLRHLTQLRDTFVKNIVAFKCRIKSLLLLEALDFPKASAGSQWSLSVLRQLEQLPCAQPIRFKLDQLLSGLCFAQQQAVLTQKQIRTFCAQDPELSESLQYLRSIPGIGWIVAVHLLARIGDWRLLNNVRQIAGFLGFVPREFSTGDRVCRGSITGIGDRRLQAKLIQSAWTAIRKDPQIAAFYQNIYQRHPRDRASRKAIVAVARKLTTRIYCVLKEQRPYVVR